MNRSKDFWRIVLFFSVINFVLFAIFKSTLHFSTDMELFYSPLAISLLEGKGYVIESQFYTHHPPLFPFFLAGIYWLSKHWTMGNPVYAFLVLILQAFSCGFLYLFSAGFCGRRAGLLSAYLFGLYPFFVVLTATKYSSTPTPLFTFVFFASLVLYGRLIKEGGFYLAGLNGFVLGLAALVWAAAVHLWVVFVVNILLNGIHRKMIVRNFLILSFLAGFLIPTLSWSYYIYRNTGQKIFVSSALTSSMVDGLVRHDYMRNYPLVKAAKAKREAGQLNQPKHIILLYWNALLADPISTMKFSCYKSLRAWFGTDSEKYDSAVLLIQIPYLILALWGTYVSFGKNQQGAGLLLAVVLYFWGVTFSALSILRYMIPAMGILMVFAATGILDLFHRTPNAVDKIMNLKRILHRVEFNVSGG